MDDKEALALLIKKKELGITDEELETFKQRFNAKHQAPVPDVKAEDLIPATPWDDITEEELRYFATPYYDELQAKKKLQVEQRKEDEALK